jgi:GAF domain-containing protein
MRASHKCDAGISLSNQSASNLSHVQPWGLIYAPFDIPEFFSIQDLRFLEAVARWIGIIIDRAETVERMRY